MAKQLTFTASWPKALHRRVEADAKAKYMRFNAWLEKAAEHELTRDPALSPFLVEYLRRQEEAWRERHSQLLEQLQALIDSERPPIAEVVSLAKEE